MYLLCHLQLYRVNRRHGKFTSGDPLVNEILGRAEFLILFG